MDIKNVTSESKEELSVEEVKYMVGMRNVIYRKYIV